MKYWIITQTITNTDGLKEFILLVQEMLDQGWQAYGELQVVSQPNGTVILLREFTRKMG